MHAVNEAALRPVAIQQGHEKLEVLLLPVVRRRRHQQEVPGQGRQQLAEAIPLRVFDLAAEERRRQLVCLITNNQVPAAVRRLKFLLHILVARELVESGNGQIGLKKPVARPRRLKLIVG